MSASRSLDPEGDLLTFEWEIGSDVLEGEEVTAPWSMIATGPLITLNVSDGCSTRSATAMRIHYNAPPYSYPNPALLQSLDANVGAALSFSDVQSLSPKRAFSISQSYGALSFEIPTLSQLQMPLLSRKPNMPNYTPFPYGTGAKAQGFGLAAYTSKQLYCMNGTIQSEACNRESTALISGQGALPLFLADRSIKTLSLAIGQAAIYVGLADYILVFRHESDMDEPVSVIPYAGATKLLLLEDGSKRILYTAKYSAPTQIFDVTDSSSPELLSSSSLRPHGLFKASDGENYLYSLTGPTQNQLEIHSLANPSSPTLVSSLGLNFNATQQAYSDGFLYLLYYESYVTRIKWIDLSDPTNPTLHGTGATDPTRTWNKLFSAQGKALVAGIGENLLRVLTPQSAPTGASLVQEAIIGEDNTDDVPIADLGGGNFLAGGTNVRILNIENEMSLNVVDLWPISCKALALTSNYILLGTRDNHLIVASRSSAPNYSSLRDLSLRSDKHFIIEVAGSNWLIGIDRSGKYVAFNASQALSATPVSVTLPYQPLDLALITASSGIPYAFILDNDSYLRIYDISNPTSPILRRTLGGTGPPTYSVINRIMSSGTKLYTASHAVAFPSISWMEMADPLAPAPPGGLLGWRIDKYIDTFQLSDFEFPFAVTGSDPLFGEPARLTFEGGGISGAARTVALPGRGKSILRVGNNLLITDSLSGVNLVHLNAPPAPRISLSGRVIQGSSGLAGVSVQAGRHSAITNSSGYFTISDIPWGLYHLEAQVTGKRVLPLNFVNPIEVDSDRSDLILSSLPSTSRIVKGLVRAGNKGLPDATISAGSISATSDTFGRYTLYGLPTGTTSLVASHPSYNITPDGFSSPISLGTEDLLAVDFKATLKTYSISGRVTKDGAGLAGVLISSGEFSATTNSQGNFTLPPVAPGVYTLTPSLLGHEFTPSTREVTVTNSAVSGQDFVASSMTYSISGLVQSTVGVPLQGASILLNGEIRATTAADGTYSISGLANGSYTLAGQKLGYNVYLSGPVWNEVIIDNASVVNANFFYGGLTISGRITGMGASGATVSFGGASATTNSQGRYNIYNAPGGTHNLLASRPGYLYTPQFSNPVSLTYNHLIDLDFYGTVDNASSSSTSSSSASSSSSSLTSSSYSSSSSLSSSQSSSAQSSSSSTSSNNLSYTWHFGDGQGASGISASHAFPAPGTYQATLQAGDNCGATPQKTLQVVVRPDPGPLEARFRVLTLRSVDTQSGAEDWQEIDVDSEQVEIGQQVKLDGTISSGNPGFYFWDFGNGTYGDDSVESISFTDPGPHSIELSVSSPDMMEHSVISKTINVADNLAALSYMPPSGTEFRPRFYALNGNTVWAYSLEGQIAKGDLSNPLALPALQRVSSFTTGGVPVYGMAFSGNRVCLARGSGGVELYYPSVTTFTKLASISYAQLGNSQALSIAASGNALYVAAFEAGLIYVYNTSSGGAQFVRTIAPQGGVYFLVTPDSGHLVSRSSNGTLNIYDLQDPFNPQQVGTPIQLPASAVYYDSASAGIYAARGGGFTIIQPMPTSTTELPPYRFTYLSSNNYTLNSRRFYVISTSSQAIRKYSLIESDPALMQDRTTGDWNMSIAFLHDPDGNGPQEEVLIVGAQSTGGFSALRP